MTEIIRYAPLILFAGAIQICVYLTVWRVQVWYVDRKATQKDLAK